MPSNAEKPTQRIKQNEETEGYISNKKTKYNQGEGGTLVRKKTKNKKQNLSMRIQLLMAKSKQIFIPNCIHFLVFSFVTPVR